MPKLEINFADGRSETRRLSRRNPIVIGRNPISDVHVDDDAIAPIHCRVHWNGQHFEVAATSDEGVDVNGVLVKRKHLAVGDLIRVGSADMLMVSSSGRREPKHAITQEAHAVPATAAPDDPVAADRQTEELSDADWGTLAGDHKDSAPVEFSEALPPHPAPTRDEPQTEASREPEPEPDFDAKPEILDDKPDTPETKPEKFSRPPTWTRLHSKRRPGEQDVLTSPLVLSLGGLALGLLLAAGAIWFLIGRENANRLYESARADRESGRYTQAIAAFEKFLLDYPADNRIPEVRHALGMTRIERHVGGASPDFENALKAFDEFVRAHRDSPEFESLTPALATLARDIASAASAAAIRTGDRSYLAPAEQAGKLFTRYGPEGPPAEEAQANLDAEFANAQAAVRKHEYFEQIAEIIESAIKNKDFIAAYQARNDLLARYSNFRDDRRITSLLTQALDAERALIQPVADPLAKSMPLADLNERRPPVMLIGHTQARLGETSDGRLIIALARDQLVGLDVVTGKPIWRITVGLDSPFFPIEVDASVPALLAFDAARLDLLLLARDSGEPLWRTHIGHLAGGPPRIAQGQIDLATADGHLVRLGLDSGQPLAEVAFPQPLVGSPIITADGEHLAVFGEQSTAYVLDLRTLETRGVSFVGHPAGSLATSPQRLGQLLLVYENDQLNSATIRALAFDPGSAKLTSVATERVEGAIRIPPMPRGNILFVPSSFERVTAFSISDDPGQPPLTRLAGVQITNPRDVPTFLVPGPDGMLWAAGSALRKLQIQAEDLKILPGELAPGLHQQPVQESGEGLFVARSLPASNAVYVSQADRDSMSGNWRTVLGANIIAQAVSEDELTLITAAGQVGVVTPADLEKPAFLNTTLLPEWDEASVAPLEGTSLPGGQGLIWQSGKQPKLWRINPATAVAAPQKLSAALQAAPIALPGGLILPVPGRLEWIPDSDGAPIDPFLLPVTGEKANLPAWHSVVPLDETSFAALADDGTLRVLRRRDEPRPHLAQIAIANLPRDRGGALAAFEESLFLAVGNRLEKRDPAGLRPTAEHEFPDPIQAGPWIVGPLAIVRTEAGAVVALDAATLEQRWQLQMNTPLAGPPLPLDDQAENPVWLIAAQDGTIAILENQGTERARFALPQRLAGLSRLANIPVALTLAGALVPIAPADPPAPTAKTAAPAPNEEQP